LRPFSYRIVNVFTQPGIRLSGNPLCVFEAGGSLETQAMQALALQFNLSETTFIFPSTHADASVRIFTPKYEMPFAGHPTLGTAHICRSLGLAGDSLKLEMPAGIVPVTARGDCWTLEARSRGSRPVRESRAELAALLGIQEQEVGERPLWVDTGREQMIVPLTSEVAVRRACVRADLLNRLESKDGAGMAYIFARTGDRVFARFFFAQGGMAVEDPATGSATAGLGGWFVATGETLPAQVEISQGELTGRPSALELRVDARQRIFVTGEVVEIGRGAIEL
jgi:trans-2,3-dihydro-3-hydroxyanthranilate isomerase